MLPEHDLRLVLPTTPLIDTQGPWFRSLRYRYLQGPPPGAAVDSPPQPLWPGGAPLLGARFTPKGSFETIYLALDPDTANDESRGVIRLPGSAPPVIRSEPWVTITVDGAVMGILDTTDMAVQAALGTSYMELTGNWLTLQARGLVPPTHILGRVTYDCGVTGILYDSAMNRQDGQCLAIFPDVLRRGAGHLSVYDPAGRLAQRLP